MAGPVRRQVRNVQGGVPGKQLQVQAVQAVLRGEFADRLAHWGALLYLRVAGLRLWYCRRYNYGTRRIYGDTLAQVVFQMLCSVRWMPHRPIWPVASPM